LIGQGCKNLFHITGNLSRNVYADRLAGFEQALADHQIVYNPQHLLINNLTAQEGTVAARKLLALPQLPDGVFVANDTCAVSCMLELMEQGIRIPEDVAFSGFNNDPISCIIKPNLSTIHYKGFDMGETAAKTLISYLHDSQSQHQAQRIVLPHELIIRQSSLKHANS
jgi:LacI family transcriptional regulator